MKMIKLTSSEVLECIIALGDFILSPSNSEVNQLWLFKHSRNVLKIILENGEHKCALSPKILAVCITALNYAGEDELAYKIIEDIALAA